MLEEQLHVFAKEKQDIGEGRAYLNQQASELTLMVDGDAAGLTMTVTGTLAGATVNLPCVRLSDMSIVDSITSAGAYVVAAVSGFEVININITAISSGSVTVTGRACY